MDRYNISARRLFMVLSPRSLDYARLALESLYRNCEDRFHIYLITDSSDDAGTLTRDVSQISERSARDGSTWSVHSFLDLEEREDQFFGKFENIRVFRRGHPCWRKITDPILLSADREEMVILDPDLYFPNRFCFEPVPETGVYLMWQKPSCLLPHETVERALEANVPLAHHTDIGVAQWRLPVDLEWLDWLIAKLGSPELPPSMHVESIVWAALAMRCGGGHLDPQTWFCWHRSQYKRISLKIGVAGASILKAENFTRMKCFHAGGEAKWWLREAERLGTLKGAGPIVSLTPFKPFIELTPDLYYSMQGSKRLLRKLGYYSVFGQT